MNEALYVKHNGEAKMVGKTFAVDGETILFHEEKGNQRLAKHDCPGGVDEALVDYMVENCIERYFHKVRNHPEILVASIDDLITIGAVEKLDGRCRHFLPTAYWSVYAKKVVVPWVEDERTL